MSKRVLIGLSVLGVALIAAVILVAVYVPGDNITRGLAVLGFLIALGKTGYDIWEKERERRKKLEAANSPVELKVHDVFFRYRGRDVSGGVCETTKARAMYVSYWFKFSAFNSRSENVGLTDIFLNFAKGGTIVHEQGPSEHTGETRHAVAYCPEVKTITLPSREWFSMTFQGSLGQGVLAALAECDDIYLTAKSTTGEPFRVQLALGILEGAEPTHP